MLTLALTLITLWASIALLVRSAIQHKRVRFFRDARQTITDRRQEQMIDFLSRPYTAHKTHGGYVVKLNGKRITEFDGPDAFERAQNRCYQLNRARLLN